MKPENMPWHGGDEMTWRYVEDCRCTRCLHEEAPTCPECGSPMFASGYYGWLRCSNYEGCENA